MFIRRSTSSNPTQAEITELEQVLVVEQDAPAQVLEAGQSVICIGEAVNDRGVPEIPRRLQAKGELDSYYGGFKSWLGSAADGFEGNLYVHLWPVKFPDLIIITVDLEAGEVTFTGSCTDETKVPAGFRVSDGTTSIWATLEDVTFVAGSYLASHTVRVRHVSGASTQPISGIDTLVDAAPTGLTMTVSNAAEVIAVDVDTAYMAAIDAALDETSVAADGTIIFSCRHSQPNWLRLHVDQASSGGRGRIAVVSPPIGVTQGTATGSSAQGVAGNRSDRVVYAWPGVKWLFPQYSSSEYITTHFDAFVASQIAHTNPEESPGQAKPFMSVLMGVEAGITPTRAFYKAMKAAGICSLNIDKLGNRIIYSAVTASLTQGKEPIEQRRCSDMIQDSIAEFLATYKDVPLSETNKQGSKDAVDGFLEGLLFRERISAYQTDIDSVNTPATLALGIFYILVKVKRTPAAKYIVLLTQIGTTVQISEQ